MLQNVHPECPDDLIMSYSTTQGLGIHCGLIILKIDKLPLLHMLRITIHDKCELAVPINVGNVFWESSKEIFKVYF